MTPTPFVPNLLTPDLDQEFQAFLGSILGPGTFEVHPLAGDASARRYFRVVAHDDSWVLMLWDPFQDDGKYPFLSVRAHFEKHGVHVPKVIGMRPEKGLVLLEDLGDLTLERRFWESQKQEMALPDYRAAIDELIKMHYDCTADQSSPCVAFTVEFDTAKLLWEMNYGREHLISGLSMELNRSPLTERAEKQLTQDFTAICETLHREPKFIAHRDYHSRNVMIKLGRVRIIDFQDARMGSIQYDLVSLLRDSYVSLNDDMQTILLDYYLDERKQALERIVQTGDPTFIPQNVLMAQRTPFSREHFDRIFEVQTIQRCFKACGSFASFYRTRSDTRYLKYLQPTLATVKRSLGHFPEYRGFFQVLEDQGLFDQNFDEVGQA